MPQHLQLLGQCAPHFNLVLYGEALCLAALDIEMCFIALIAESRTEWRKAHPVFSVYAIFYILPSNPRLPITFLMLVIPGFTSLLDRSSTSWLILPLPCNALTEVVILPFPYEAWLFLCSWLQLNEKLSSSSLPCLTLSLLELKGLSGPCQV